MAGRKQSFPRNMLQTSKYSLPSVLFCPGFTELFPEPCPGQGDAKAPEEHSQMITQEMQVPGGNKVSGVGNPARLPALGQPSAAPCRQKVFWTDCIII